MTRFQILGLESNVFFFLIFSLKNYACCKKSTSAFLSNKLVLLYGGKSVKLGILKHVSLRLTMISKWYFYLYFALVWPNN